MYIHKSILPKHIRKQLKDEEDWIQGTVFFLEDSRKACFINDIDKVLFEFTKPVLLSQNAYIIRYLAVVFTKINKEGVQEGELCELIFHFNKPEIQ